MGLVVGVHGISGVGLKVVGRKAASTRLDRLAVGSVATCIVDVVL